MHGSVDDDPRARYAETLSSGNGIQEPSLQTFLGAGAGSVQHAVPFPPSRYIARPRVTARIREALTCGVAVVRAFRGSGTRTAVAELVDQDGIATQTMWCTVEELGHLDALSTRKDPIALLVVEDRYGTAADRVIELAQRLRTVMGSQICVITRDSAPYQRPATISKLDLEVVDAQTLLFSEEEIAALAETFGLRITPSAMESIARVTGGWAEGLKVALSSFARADSWIDDENVEAMLRPGIEWVRELGPAALDEALPTQLWTPISIPSFVDESLLEASETNPELAKKELEKLVRDGVATRELHNGESRWRLNPLLRSALVASIDEKDLREAAGLMSEVLLQQNKLAEAIRLSATSNATDRVLRATNRAFGRLALNDWLQLATDVPPAALLRMPTLISLRGSIEERLPQKDRLEWRTNPQRPVPDPLELAGLAAELRAQGDLTGELNLLPALSKARSQATNVETLSALQIQEISALLSLGRFTVASHQATLLDIEPGMPLFRALYLAALRTLSQAAIGNTAQARTEAKAARSIDAREFYIGSQADAEFRLAAALTDAWAGRPASAESALETLKDDVGPTPYQLLRRIAKALVHFFQGDADRTRHQLQKAAVLAEIASADEARELVEYLRARISLITGEVQPVEHSSRASRSNHSAWGHLTSAQYALLRHDFESTQTAVEAALHLSPSQSASHLTGLFLLAAALYRAANHNSAAKVANTAFSSAQSGSTVFPLLAIPHSDLVALAELVDEESSSLVQSARDLQALALRGDMKGRTLTRRERQIVAELASGDTFEQIARRLFVSENTLRSHTRSLYRKLGVQSRHDAVSRSLQFGILPPHPSAPATGGNGSMPSRASSGES